MVSLVVARWFLPVSKKMNREERYNQILGFTSSAADVIDIADYMQDPAFTDLFIALRAIQVAFGFSVMQFSFSIAATKKRNMSLVGVRNIIDILFATEAWALLLMLFSQEMPCFAIRILVVAFTNWNRGFSLYFFMIKNALMITLYVYRVCFLVLRQLRTEMKVKPNEMCLCS